LVKDECRVRGPEMQLVGQEVAVEVAGLGRAVAPVIDDSGNGLAVAG
jgi:hypothetical protein